ncbi:hypothetical protein EXIGLDRAFT_838953 [Exidia glandulosa HHB12029]|uniref:Uncharacterized protein n=1 Tax=Exidia glandulosa HHB12029 TaxID=1314781 RepID=A0A165FCG4_EXIGL|nr:hypothetical protein EXIGLDRAFT_838953 [Exidia glandulosa HHB12029]
MGAESVPPSPAPSKPSKSPRIAGGSIATAFPSCDARLLAAMAPHLWGSPKALDTDLVLPTASNVLDFASAYKAAHPLPQCMRLTNGKIYMRKVHDIISAQLMDAKSAVVVGTSGVGKTMFLWLEVAQRLTRSQPCAWLLHDSVVLIRSAAAEVLPFASLTDTSGFEEAILYIDWSLALEVAGPRPHVLRPEAYSLIEFCKGVIMATAPYEERWSELQTRWLHTLNVVVMPPWSFHEVHDGASTLMSFNSPTTVNRLVDRFGSIPLTIMSILSYGPTHSDAIWNQLLLAVRRHPEGARGLRQFMDTSGALSYPILPKDLLTIFLISPGDFEDLSWENSRCVLRSHELTKTVQERANEEYAAERVALRPRQSHAQLPLSPAMLAAAAPQTHVHQTPHVTPGLQVKTPYMKAGVNGSLPLFP